MPKRTDIESILVIGSGPIVIGRACEFDYSGTQAIKALRQEGYRVVLVNSSPATIMIDPEVAPGAYIEPLVPEVLKKVIAAERPTALLPTVGGQTGLNLAVKLDASGILERYEAELPNVCASLQFDYRRTQAHMEALHRQRVKVQMRAWEQTPARGDAWT